MFGERVKKSRREESQEREMVRASHPLPSILAIFFTLSPNIEPVTSDDSRTTYQAPWSRTAWLKSCLLMHCHKSITDTLDTVKIAFDCFFPKGILENLSGDMRTAEWKMSPPTFQNAPPPLHVARLNLFMVVKRGLRCSRRKVNFRPFRYHQPRPPQGKALGTRLRYHRRIKV